MEDNKIGNMPANIRRIYFNEALKVLFKFSKPSLNDVYYHACRGDHCPTEKCSFSPGWRKGRSCHHVLNIKELIDRIVSTTNID